MPYRPDDFSWRALRTFGLGWLFLAVAVSRFGLLLGAGPIPQIFLASATAIFGLLVFFVDAIGRPVWNCDIRFLVGVHVTRFVGLWFLELYNEGRLPYDFAVKGGIGDIIAASLALVVIMIPQGLGFRRTAIQVWNVIGLADILFVVATAVRLNLTVPSALNELRHLPLSILPTFLVPVIIVTHIVIGLRARRGEI